MTPRSQVIIPTLIVLAMLVGLSLMSPWLYQVVFEPRGWSRDRLEGLILGIQVALPVGMLVLAYAYPDAGARWLVTRDNGYVALMLLALPLAAALLPYFWQILRLVFLAMGLELIAATLLLVFLLVAAGFAYLRRP